MSRKVLALVAILMVAILGAYTASLISAGRFQLSDVIVLGRFTVRATKIVIYGGPPSLLMRIAVAADGKTPIAFANQTNVEITDLNLTKEEDGKILEICAARATGWIVVINMTRLEAKNVTLSHLTIESDPEYEQSAENVTMCDVYIQAVCLFARFQELYEMEINVKSS